MAALPLPYAKASSLRTHIHLAAFAQEQLNRHILEINELLIGEGRTSDPGTISTRIIRDAIASMAMTGDSPTTTADLILDEIR